MMKAYIKRILNKCLYHMSKKMAHSLIYFRYHHCFLNWKNPQSYDEKIHWLMIYYYDDKYGVYVDKYEVRKYIKECGLDSLLIPLLGVYADSKMIDYAMLPKKFILKTTHGSGDKFYYISDDKRSFQKDTVNEKLDIALKENFAERFCEYQYSKIVPQIICEQLLETNERKSLTDYKVVCTCGVVRAILVCNNRKDGRDYYSPQWEYLDYVKDIYRSGIVERKPQKLSEMIRAAEIISKPFPLARIDFYIVSNKLYFGEITLTPSSGNHIYLNDNGQRKLGAYVKLPALDRD